MKCLALLIRKVHEGQVIEVCNRLCDLLLDGKDTLRDIYFIGLRTLISDVPKNFGTTICDHLTDKLLGGLVRQNDVAQQNCIDLLSELCRRFGHLNDRDHEKIMSCLLDKLRSHRTIISRKAAVALGSLALVSSDGLLNNLVGDLLKSVPDNCLVNFQISKNFIQTIVALSRVAGHRLGLYAGQIIPLILQFCGAVDDDNLYDESFIELREHCFSILESFVRMCPKEVGSYTSKIVESAISFIKFDPNYSYDFPCGDEDAGSEQEGFCSSEDDDSSWKVRKAAVKVITAIVATYPELPLALVCVCFDSLCERFKEREEIVKIDIINSVAQIIMLRTVSESKLSESIFFKTELKARSPILFRLAMKYLSHSDKVKESVYNFLRLFVSSIEVYSTFQ